MLEVVASHLVRYVAGDHMLDITCLQSIIMGWSHPGP